MKNPKMIVKIIVFGCLIYTISAQNENTRASVKVEEGERSAPLKKCLTGYMTDVQSWVRANGSLTATSIATQTAVDLSYNPDALSTLLFHLSKINSKQYSVRILSMANCGLPEIPQIFYWTDSKNQVLSDTIEYVSFYGNKFDLPISNEEDYAVLMNATHSRELMGDRLIQRMSRGWSSGFTGVQFPKLKELDLRSCSIAVLEDRVFMKMTSLESLYLGENEIIHIEANAFEGLKTMVHLDLSRNFPYDLQNNVQKPLVFESMELFSDLENLHSLDFSFTKLTHRNTVLTRSLSPKLIKLSLCYCNLGPLADDAFKTSSLRYLDMSGNFDILSKPKILRGLEHTLIVLYAEETGLKTMEPFKNFRKLEILKLTDNEITVLPKHIIETLSNLQVLDLDKNRMMTWFDSHMSLMPKLRILSLRHNNINMITDEMAMDLVNVSYVGLAENFIICNCNVRDLYELGWRNEQVVADQKITRISSGYLDKRIGFHTGFQDYNNLIEHRIPVTRVCDHKNKCDLDMKLQFKGDLLFLDYKPKEYVCLSLTESKSTGFQNFPTCIEELNNTPADLVQKTWNRFLLFIIPAILLPALALLFVFRRNFRYFLITMRNSATLSLINKNIGHDECSIFNYDVFVSYCNEDRAWVLDQLLPHVERDCNISVCLHERDFQVGLSILENIVSCMDRSRSIMLILSQRFLLSQWCQFEMHLAQHRLLETRREDLILILLEEIPRRLRPNTLHYLMLTKTYIVWPRTEGERNHFWKRLKKSLVTHKLKNTENVSLA